MVWIRGNHDEVDTKFMSHLLGVKVKGHYSWNVGSRRCYATHGDRWDVYIYKYRFLSEAITGAYNFLRGFSSKAMRKLTKFLKTRSKMMLRNHEAILHNAVSYGKVHGMDGVFCGHTHRASLNSWTASSTATAAPGRAICPILSAWTRTGPTLPLSEKRQLRSRENH